MRGICYKKSIFYDALVFRTRWFSGEFILSLYLKCHIQEWQGVFCIQHLCTKYVKKNNNYSVFSLHPDIWFFIISLIVIGWKSSPMRNKILCDLFALVSSALHAAVFLLAGLDRHLLWLVGVIAWPWTYIHSFNVRLSSLYTQL